VLCWLSSCMSCVSRTGAAAVLHAACRVCADAGVQGVYQANYLHNSKYCMLHVNNVHNYVSDGRVLVHSASMCCRHILPTSCGTTTVTDARRAYCSFQCAMTLGQVSGCGTAVHMHAYQWCTNGNGLDF
jgi:hypothetical protein